MLTKGELGSKNSEDSADVIVWSLRMLLVKQYPIAARLPAAFGASIRYWATWVSCHVGSPDLVVLIVSLVPSKIG